MSPPDKIKEVKWNEVLSLAALLAAVVISWIAYREYQPILLERFSLQHLSGFLLITKALVLSIIPIGVGWVTDRLLVKQKNYFLIYTVRISLTAMIFMVVASTSTFWLRIHPSIM